ncbi:18644_t:CDS:1, partial [Racocetra persica]
NNETLGQHYLIETSSQDSKTFSNHQDSILTKLWVSTILLKHYLKAVKFSQIIKIVF